MLEGRILKMNWKVRVCHSYEGTNKCAKTLVILDCASSGGLREFDICHVQVD